AQCTHSVSAHHVLFANDTAPTDIYTLSLHDALPISAKANRDPLRHYQAARKATSRRNQQPDSARVRDRDCLCASGARRRGGRFRSEEHTSELQSRENLVCRLLLEKKKKKPER